MTHTQKHIKTPTTAVPTARLQEYRTSTNKNTIKIFGGGEGGVLGWGGKEKQSIPVPQLWTIELEPIYSMGTTTSAYLLCSVLSHITFHRKVVVFYIAGPWWSQSSLLSISEHLALTCYWKSSGSALPSLVDMRQNACFLLTLSVFYLQGISLFFSPHLSRSKTTKTLW